jgi:hypothetical protein
MMTGLLRSVLRRQLWWIQLRELQREGAVNALRRAWIQRAIDRTPPVITDTHGPIEVRILTWRRDWRNAVWALKSFYAHAGVRYPLFIHDGGLLSAQTAALRRHFPAATIVMADAADAEVEQTFERAGHLNSLRYRRKNGLTRQLFDFFMLSEAEQVITIDSDVLFFARPSELIGPRPAGAPNLYTRDSAYFYSMTLDELQAALGVRPPPYYNTGVCLVSRRSIDFALIERCLAEPKMFADSWITEQTLHAITGSAYGSDYLPDSYVIEPRPAMPRDAVCKHYPGLYRQRLYDEGMAYLQDNGFIERLHAMPRNTGADLREAQPARQP